MKDFYLEQMGIERWILRPTISTKVLVICADEIVFPFQGKASLLFEQIINSMNLKLNDVHCTAEKMAHIAYKQQQPELVWLIDAQVQFNISVPTLKSASLEALIASPIEKKQVYLDLLSVLSWPH